MVNTQQDAERYVEDMDLDEVEMLDELDIALLTDPTTTQYNAIADVPVKEIGLKRLKLIQPAISLLERVLDPIEEAGGLFTVVEEPHIRPNGELVPDRKSIVDADADEYVATVGINYSLVENREAFTQFTKILRSSGLDTSGMKVTPTVTPSKIYTTFTFPNHMVEVGEGDVVELMITVLNSYDGSTRFSLKIGGFRLLCKNGMGIGELVNVFSKKHSSSYNNEELENYLGSSIKSFAKAGKEWKAMKDVPVTDDEALQVVRIAINKGGKCEYGDAKGKLKDALSIWESYRNSMGSNKWSLLNTITHLSTHVSTKRGNIVSLKVYAEALRDKAVKLLKAA